jgi:uncharacterized protein (UPF0548 family)
MFSFQIFLKIMISLKKPSIADIQQFIANQQMLSFTYPEAAVGSTQAGKTVIGFNNDALRVMVGQGYPDLQHAKIALTRWVHFPKHWTPVIPDSTPIQTGQTVTVNFHLAGLWWTNAARIVYVEDQPNQFGFAYGTLPGHIERGEELFRVSMDEQERVWYEIRAFSQPRWWPVWLIYPFARLLQDRFRRDSADAVRRYVQSNGQVIEKAAFRPDQWLLACIIGIVTAFVTFPGTMLHHDYGQLPLIFAMVFITPYCFHLLHDFRLTPPTFHHKILKYLFPAAILTTISQLFPASWLTALVALPWLVMGGFSLLNTPLIWKQSAHSIVARSATIAALIFFFVATVWAFSDRLGLFPMGFDAAIGRLTALHFHYAGLALPVICALLAIKAPNNRWNQWAIAGIITGVPLTAIGITATHDGYTPLIETIAAVWMAISGLLAGLGLLLWGTRTLRHGSWIAGILLVFTMSLALSYALRPYFPQNFHTLDWMRAVHGSLNGLLAIPLALGSLAQPRQYP